MKQCTQAGRSEVHWLAFDITGWVQNRMALCVATAWTGRCIVSRFTSNNSLSQFVAKRVYCHLGECTILYLSVYKYTYTLILSIYKDCNIQLHYNYMAGVSDFVRVLSVKPAWSLLTTGYVRCMFFIRQGLALWP